MNRAPCYDVPKHHANLWGEYADGTLKAHDVATVGDDRAAGFSDAFLPEMFHRFYAETPCEVSPEDRERSAAVRARLHDLASELPEFSTLRKQTVRSPLWAGMAATTVAESLAETLPARTSTTDADEARRILAGLKACASASADAEAAFAAHVARAEGTSRGADVATVEAAGAIDETAVRTALRAGIVAAQKSIDDAQDTLSAFGWGTGAGGESVHHSPAVAVELARRVASSETLKKIVALAGRLTMIARAKRATRSPYARSEVIGLEPTGDVERLLPCELVALADPLSTAALYRRLLEHSALGYQVQGKEPEGKGPIVVVIDQSSSMTEADRDVWAKAVALALLDAARAEKRAFGIVLYNGGVVASQLFPHPAESDPRAILDLLARVPSGGTDYAPGIGKALDFIESAGTFKRADVVHITDGVASADAAPIARARAKAIGCHLFGIGIGRIGPALTAWSDDAVEIRDVSADSPAVDLIFDSI
jgi:hypothetical protein